jgi:hypothetical protein
MELADVLKMREFGMKERCSSEFENLEIHCFGLKAGSLRAYGQVSTTQHEPRTSSSGRHGSEIEFLGGGSVRVAMYGGS